MNLVLAQQQVLALTKLSFASFPDKMVLFYYPYDRLTEQAFLVYERIQEHAPLPLARLNCLEEREFCKRLEVFTFPLVVAYYGGHNYTYSDVLDAGRLLRFGEAVMAPTFRQETPPGVHFRLVTPHTAQQEEYLFAAFKLSASFSIAEGPQRALTAVFYDYEVRFNGSFEADAVRRFVLQYQQPFPVLNGSSYKRMKAFPLAVFAHEPGDYRPSTLYFPDDGFLYVQMDGKRFSEFSRESGCETLPCALVLNGSERFSRQVAGFEDFLGFVQLVRSNSVYPYAKQIYPRDSAASRGVYDFALAKSAIRAVIHEAPLARAVCIIGGSVIIIGLAVLVGRLLACQKPPEQPREPSCKDQQPEAGEQHRPATARLLAMSGYAVRKQSSASNLNAKAGNPSNAFAEPMLDRATSSLSAIIPSHSLSAADNSSLDISTSPKNAAANVLKACAGALVDEGMKSDSEKAEIEHNSDS